MINRVEMPEHQLSAGHPASPATPKLPGNPPNQPQTPGDGSAELTEGPRSRFVGIICVERGSSRCVHMENTKRNTKKPSRVFWALVRKTSAEPDICCLSLCWVQENRSCLAQGWAGDSSERGTETSLPEREPSSLAPSEMSFALQLNDIYCHLLANPRRGTGGTVTRTGTHNLLRSPELHRGRPRGVCNGTRGSHVTNGSFTVNSCSRFCPQQL